MKENHICGPDSYCDVECMEAVAMADLVATVRRVANEQPLYRTETRTHLFLAAAELERLSYPRRSADIKTVPQRGTKG